MRVEGSFEPKAIVYKPSSSPKMRNSHLKLYHLLGIQERKFKLLGDQSKPYFLEVELGEHSIKFGALN